MLGSVAWRGVERAVKDLEDSGVRIGVAASGPNGRSFEFRSDEKFIAASTVKIPLMVELYRRVDTGELNLDQKFSIDENLKGPGSGVLLHMRPGLVVALEDLIYLMISISDNTATNILIDLAGMDRVNRTMRSMSMAGSNLGRHMKGRAAMGDEVENWATPSDYRRVIEVILQGNAASPTACRQMTDMLRKQQNRRRIARSLPEDTEIDWGTKTGSVAGVANDVGFVRTERASLVLSIFTEGFAVQVDAEAAIGQIAREAMIAAQMLPPGTPARTR